MCMAMAMCIPQLDLDADENQYLVYIPAYAIVIEDHNANFTIVESAFAVPNTMTMCAEFKSGDTQKTGVGASILICTMGNLRQ